MATNITIKRYNGSTWDELSPSTTIGQVSGLQTSLNTLTNDKQDKSNLVTSVSSSSTDVQYPSAKLFYDTTTDIMEVAEGKTATYVTTLYPSSAAYYILFSHTEVAADTAITSLSNYSYVSITDSTNDFAVQDSYLCLVAYSNNSYVISSCVSVGSIKTGDVVLITNTNVPDYWFDSSSNYFNKLETTKADLSNYVTINTTQTIGGAKYFTGATSFDNASFETTGTTKFKSGKLELGGSQREKLYSIILDCAGSDTSGRTLTLPDATGTIALTSDIAYPTTFTWTAGTSAGPTGTLSGTNMSPVSFGAIPSASSTQTGIVTLDAQTFSGAKQFATTTTFQVAARWRNGNNDSYSTIQGNSSATSSITLTLPASTGTLSLMQTFLDSNQPSGAHVGDIWYQTAS